MKLARQCLLVACVAVAACAAAYRSSQDLTSSENDKLRQATWKYETCVANEALGLDDGYDQPTQIASVAETNCSSARMDLQQTMIGLRLSPYFQEGYLGESQKGAQALAATAILHRRQPASN
jgi:hypothetical protein